MKIIKNIILVVLLFSSVIHADAINNVIRVGKLIKSSKAFSPKKISEFAKILEEIKGTKKLGQVLGKMNLKNELLEDTFMRLAIYRNKIDKVEAKEMFINLSGSKGFRSTLKKVVGNSSQKTAGHLNELKIANNATKSGFKVKGIGEPFLDGIKKSATDIDVLLTRKNKTFAIEAKDYASKTQIPLDKVRGDMDTLVSYKNKNLSKKVIPVFSMTNKPKNALKLKQLEKIAEKKGVQLIFGNPQEQIEQLKLLGEIL
ncbi:MAG TPA: hypothetical protein EYG80_02670 [Flavobacteriaceae bacterium]|nr:hypothetical protein [Flavobacteriaceae bacterium]HIP48465.1 hypothetical protein [Lutibacter sp.]